MADLTALKQSIAAAIRANGEGAITGPVLQDQLLDMVDAMEVDTFGGFLTADTVPPTDTTVPHIFIGYSQEGTIENAAFDITVAEGEVWIVCRMADEDEWTKANLTSNLLNRVQALEEGTQTKLTEGDGISIEDNTISTKIGSGLAYDNNGNMVVDTDTIATKQGVEDYVSGQKNEPNGIAGLDGNGKVGDEQLPNDVAYFEEGVDPTDPEYQEEYQRILCEDVPRPRQLGCYEPRGSSSHTASQPSGRKRGGKGEITHFLQAKELNILQREPKIWQTRQRWRRTTPMLLRQTLTERQKTCQPPLLRLTKVRQGQIRRQTTQRPCCVKFRVWFKTLVPQRKTPILRHLTLKIRERMQRTKATRQRPLWTAARVHIRASTTD